MLIDLGLCASLHAVVCTSSVGNSTRVFISLCAAAFLPCSVIMFESPGKFHINVIMFELVSRVLRGQEDWVLPLQKLL